MHAPPQGPWTPANFHALLTKNTGTAANSKTLVNLEAAIKRFPQFYSTLLPSIVKLANGANLNDLERYYHASDLEFTRLHISQILAASFLCSEGIAGHSFAQRNNFYRWFTGESEQNVQKIICLLNYFEYMSNQNNIRLETVTYKLSRTRPFMGVIENPSKTLSDLRVEKRASSSRDVAKIVIIDNQNIGEQLFSSYCFQEEIEYVTHPELMLAGVFGTFRDSDAVVVNGARKFSNHSGFGVTFRCKEHFDGIRHPGPAQTIVMVKVGVVRDGALQHYNKESFNNAIKSAFAGMHDAGSASSIAFHFWGFSDLNVPSGYNAERAVMADPAVIVMVMWIAASMAFKDVIFWQILNHNLGKNVAELFDKLHHLTIQEAYRELKKYCEYAKTNPSPHVRYNNLIYDTIRLKPGYLKVPVAPNEEIWRWTRSKMQSSNVSHKNMKTITSYNIINVYQIFNYRLWERFLERKHEINMPANFQGSSTDESRLFHGTQAADAISKDGFNIKRFCKAGGMFGFGIYFANLSSKSNQYTLQGFRGKCKMHSDAECTLCTRSLLICRVAFGKKHLATGPMNTITEAPNKCHSVEATSSTMTTGSLQYPEFIVYNDFQAYPGFIVEYKIVH